MYFVKSDTVFGAEIRYVVFRFSDGSVQSFIDHEDNNSPERQAYLAWVAEGNTAEEWNPEN